MAIRHGEQIVWLMKLAGYATAAVAGYLLGFFLGRRRFVWILLGAAAGGAAGGMAVGLLQEATERALSVDSGASLLSEAASGAGIGLLLALLLTAIQTWAQGEDPSHLTR